jgi:hypothetical protein
MWSYVEFGACAVAAANEPLDMYVWPMGLDEAVMDELLDMNEV